MNQKLFAALVVSCLFASLAAAPARAGTYVDLLPLTITAKNLYKAGCTELVLAGTEFTTSALQPGDSVTSVTLTSEGAPIDAPVGAYPILISNAQGTGLDKYDITYVNGSLSVTDGCGYLTPPLIIEGASVSVSMSVNGDPHPFSLALHALDSYVDDVLTWSILADPSHGSAFIASDSSCAAAPGMICSSADISYAPLAGYFGADTFTVRVDDLYFGIAHIQVNVSVDPLTVSIPSSALHDGWVRESSEFSAIGGSKNPSGLTFNLGDDKLNRQYRGILSFDTSSLPDNAMVTGITLKIKQSGLPKGVNPFLKLGNLAVDVKKGSFGLTTLQLGDFQSKGTKNSAFLISKVPVSNWYSGSLIALADTLVNKTGTTQMRLRFARDDNDNHVSNCLAFHSGDALDPADRPLLVIQYYIP